MRRLALRPTKQAQVFGKPDFAFVRKRVAVFCDSHFWHGYHWRSKKLELKTNREFWLRKIQSNIKRDRKVDNALRQAGWTVIRFWEHEITASPQKCADKIKRLLTTGGTGS
jgi:DNA mismatch endonuclease (patch repair protein)